MGVGNISIVNTEYFRSQKGGGGSEPTTKTPKLDKLIGNLALPTSLHAMPKQPMYYKGYIGKTGDRAGQICFKRVVWQKKSDEPFDLEDYYFLNDEYLEPFSSGVVAVDAIFCVSAYLTNEKHWNILHQTEQIGRSFVPKEKIRFPFGVIGGYCITAIVTFALNNSGPHLLFNTRELSVYLRPDGTYGVGNFVEINYNTAKLVNDIKNSNLEYSIIDFHTKGFSVKIEDVFPKSIIGSKHVADFQYYKGAGKKGFSYRNYSDYVIKQRGRLRTHWHRPHKIVNGHKRKSYSIKQYMSLFRIKFQTKRSPWIYFYLVQCKNTKSSTSYKAVCIDKKY